MNAEPTRTTMMSRRTINFVAILFTISLAGFLATQFFWIRGAFRATDETFRHMNVNALRSAMQQTGKIINYYHLELIGERIDTDPGITLDSVISPCGFDGLIQHEFSHFILHREYEYGIIDHLTGKLLFSSASGDRTNLILQSKYTRNLKSALDTERYSYVVWFPHDKMIMLRKQTNWLLLVSLLLFLGIAAGYTLTVSRLVSQKRLAIVQRDFINNTTHEFKTPLATISIAAEMILTHRKNMPESQVEKYAAIIYEENKRIQHQVDQILQLSLLENDDYHFHMKPVNIGRLLERCVETGRMMLRDSGGEISFTGKCTRAVMADQIHMTNVINNLIENGIKYSKGLPVLKVDAEQSDSGVTMIFRDEGIGIAQDQLSRIFDRMYRVPSGDLYHTPGTGIGLYYVKKVIEAHHGRITVESTLGQGSCFRVFIPFQQPV
ncbi:MAG: HAMP domain-containing sensor histidine kinase [Bacteroidales bacterium]